jgi:hypothetical protein
MLYPEDRIPFEEEDKSMHFQYHDPAPNVQLYLHRHQFPKSAEWVPFVEGWEPVYLRDFGDATRVLMEDGSQMYLGIGGNSLYRLVAGYHGIDVDKMRLHFNDATGRSQSMPLAIPSREIVLFPYKARRPKAKNDAAFGYVSDSHIKSLEVITGLRRSLRIIMKSGHELIAPTSLGNFKAVRKDAGAFLLYLHRNKIVPL